MAETKGLAPAPPKDLQPLPEIPDLQQKFEDLLQQFVSEGGNQEVRQEIETFQDVNEEGVEQAMFVAPGWSKESPPNVGVAFEVSRGRASYTGKFYESNPPAYGRVTASEFHFDSEGEGKGISGPPGIFDPLGETLTDRYDAPIIQAVANVFKKRILHSLEARDQKRIRELVQKGYRRRKGYPQVFDKFYEPQPGR